MKHNPIPVATDGSPQYDILSNIRKNDQAGKHEVEIVRDLSTGARFMLFVTKYAVSLPHADKGGAVVTVICEEGEKPLVQTLAS